MKVGLLTAISSVSPVGSAPSISQKNRPLVDLSNWCWLVEANDQSDRVSQITSANRRVRKKTIWNLPQRLHIQKLILKKIQFWNFECSRMLKFFRNRRYPNRNVQFSDRKLVQNSIRNSRISLDNFLLNPQPTKSVIADEWDAPTQFQDEENALAPLVVERKRDIVSVVLDLEDR